MVAKVHEVGQPDVIDLIKKNEIVLVINTSADKKSFKDSLDIRLAALNQMFRIFYDLRRRQCAVVRSEEYLSRR